MENKSHNQSSSENRIGLIINEVLDPSIAFERRTNYHDNDQIDQFQVKNSYANNPHKPANQDNKYDPWILYYNEEGYPYYFNPQSNESLWADDFHCRVNDSTVSSNSSTSNYISVAEDFNSLSIQKEVISSDHNYKEHFGGNQDEMTDDNESDSVDTNSSSNNDDNDSSTNSSQSDDEDNSEDEESESDTNNINPSNIPSNRTGFDRAFEVKFRAYLQTPEGQTALQEEQIKLSNKVEKIVQKVEKKNRKLSGKYDKNKKLFQRNERQSQSQPSNTGILSWTRNIFKVGSEYLQSMTEDNNDHENNNNNNKNSIRFSKLKSRHKPDNLGTYSDFKDSDVEEGKQQKLSNSKNSHSKEVKFQPTLENGLENPRRHFSDRKNSRSKISSSTISTSSSDNDSLSSDDSDVRLIAEPAGPLWQYLEGVKDSLSIRLSPLLTFIESIRQLSPRELVLGSLDVLISITKRTIETASMISSGTVCAYRSVVNLSGNTATDIVATIWGGINSRLVALVESHDGPRMDVSTELQIPNEEIENISNQFEKI